MNEKKIYAINTSALFAALNNYRKKHDLLEIENSLIASKLGILFALKTDGFVNFRSENVKLSDIQLMALHEILDQHFNAELINEIYDLTSAQEQEETLIAHQTQASDVGLVNRLKGFLKMKIQTQGNPA